LTKKLLGLRKIWNMNIGLIGINFGWGLQMANMSAIYEYLGAKPSHIPILWLAAPLTGLLIQPIIGCMSDHTWCFLGRRKPYILVGAILSSIALFFMPLSSTLWMAAVTLWILDASVNVSMGPFRALVPDLLPESQVTIGYIIQAITIAIGTVTASALPWILQNIFHVSSDSGNIPLVVRWSFWVGALVFILSILWTTLSTQELAPDCCVKKHWKETRVDMFHDIFHLPKKMWDLGWVMIFSWMGLFCMFLFFPIAVANNIFNAAPNTPQYLAGLEWAGLCFAIYAAFFLLVSFLLPYINKLISRKMIHVLSLACGGLGLVGMLLIHTKWALIWSMLGIGIAFASMQSMPYAMLANSLPEEKIGIYMGIFNLFIVVPEILISVGFGFIMQYILHNNRELAVVTGGIFMLIASLLTLRVKDVST